MHGFGWFGSEFGNLVKIVKIGKYCVWSKSMWINVSSYRRFEETFQMHSREIRNATNVTSLHAKNLTRHLKRTVKKIQTYAANDTIWGHIWKYTPEKIEKCNPCDFAGSDPSTLTKHLKTHSGENQTNAANATMHPPRQAIWRLDQLPNGPMDQWTNGPMVIWTNGTMDQWMVQWTNGSIDLWTNGPMAQWTNKPMDQWTDGPMDQWTNGPMG